jgi:DNA-binding NtrC family response regulator
LPGGTETVLLVEDDDAVLRLSKGILETLGYTVLLAGGPKQAIALAEERSGPLHLLITDVVMPEMNGRELAQHLAPLRPEMRCLFMSGYSADVIAHYGVLDDVCFLQKPFSLGALAKKVREALGERFS